MIKNNNKKVSNKVSTTPYNRGISKSKFNPIGKTALPITLESLNQFRTGATVDIESLAKMGIINKRDTAKYKIKLLNSGKLEKKLKVNIQASKKAIEQIKKAGGEYLSEAT